MKKGKKNDQKIEVVESAEKRRKIKEREKERRRRGKKEIKKKKLGDTVARVQPTSRFVKIEL